MSITLKELAKAAGVSEATASLAMNDRPGVSPSTKASIRLLAEKLGYIPSQSAQALAMKKTGLIGMIIPNISNTNYAELVQITENCLKEKGYRMILATSRNDPAYECDMIKQFISFRVEGVIIYPSIKKNPDPSYLNLLKENNIPFVYLGGYYRGIEAPVSMNDSFGATLQLSNLLLDGGGRRICLVSGCKTIVSNSFRHHAVASAMAERGLCFGEEDHFELTSTDYETAYEVFSGRMDGDFKYDSVIAVNTFVALAIYNAAIEHHFKVPEDISIVSCDAVIPQKACRINLTSLSLNYDIMVREAIRLLFQQLNGEAVRIARMTVKAELIMGDSTR